MPLPHYIASTLFMVIEHECPYILRWQQKKVLKKKDKLASISKALIERLSNNVVPYIYFNYMLTIVLMSYWAQHCVTMDLNIKA